MSPSPPSARAAGRLLAVTVAASLVLAAVCRAQRAPRRVPAPPRLLEARQLVVVTTPAWDSTTGRLWRFERARIGGRWRPVGASVPIVVGRTGLALGAGFDRLGDDAPHKREGDGRSPAGAFPLTTAFGFAAPREMRWVKLPYTQLTTGIECVDDTTSRFYNAVVDRGRARPVDWTSAERMREVAQYRIGVVVGYNAGAARIPGRGSCIFLHIWGGPRSTTVGCTAFDAGELERVIAWLDPKARPVLVQFPRAQYERLRGSWTLPELR